LAHLVLLAVVAMAIVSSYQAVGTLLVFGLLVGPPATASLLVRRVWACMVVAAGIGAVAVVSGLVISFHADTDPGATMSGIAVLIFFVVLAAQELVRLNRRPDPATLPA
jgi:ABC-type Mn2+/Zn2+ transport system permease subunit